MKGAADMMETCRAEGLENNPAWQYAAARCGLYLPYFFSRRPLKKRKATAGSVVVPDLEMTLTEKCLLPIAVAGISIEELMGGAAKMMKLCETASYENPAWTYAALRDALYQKGWSIEVLACYDPAFRFMLEWWKQLYGESEGKDGKGLLYSKK